MRFSSLWPPNLPQSGVLPWPSQKARGVPVLEWLWLPLVPPVDSTARLQGFFRCLWGFWLRSSRLGSLVFRRLARKMGLSVHWVQAPFPYRRGSLPLGSPYGPSNGSTSGKFCCLVLQEPPAIMSLVRFLSLLTAQHSSSFTETPVRGKSRLVNPCLTFSFSTFAG